MTTLRILIVDDDSSIVELLTEYLRTRGHEALAAPVSAGVSALPDDARLDVALIDLGLPQGDGLQLLRALRDRAPHLAVVMMTGRGEIAPAIQALKAGAADFLLKPFRLRDVHEALIAAVEENQRRQRSVELQGVIDFMQTARTSSPRGLGDMLRYGGPLICADLDAEGVLMALYEPAVSRWMELSRSGAEAFAGLDLDALGHQVSQDAPLGASQAPYWFGPPRGRLAAAPVHVQLAAQGRPKVHGLLVAVTERESRRAQAGLEVYAGVLGETLSRHALAAALKGDGRDGQRVFGVGAPSSVHRQAVEAVVEPAMRTMGFSPQERMAIDHALHAWTSGTPLRALLDEPESINDRLDPRIARQAADIVMGMGERFEGHGRPRGLKQRELPQPACLLAIADWWVLTTRTGALLPPMGVEEARATLEGDRGRRFNPQVASIFLRHVMPGSRSQDTMLPFDGDDEPPPVPTGEKKSSGPWYRRR